MIQKLSKEDDESVKAIELELTKLEKEIKEFHKIVDSSKKQINKLLKDRLKLNDFQIARRKGKVGLRAGCVQTAMTIN